MIYAVPHSAYDRLSRRGVLRGIQAELEHGNDQALAERIRQGELVQARDAERLPRGSRDRCYICGDEVTPCYRQKDRAHYFKHLTEPNCIGNPANPRRSKQY